ncbi:hypothetical protein MNBD_GAMMA26-2315 [hydrothermal vent metagenome]|uniref:DUF465 domain-containing protein n=1 Tax=hydrothermal vent metagenome TaxID=652676 RepID=A0A3B1BAZ0_9ZZZZ
MFECQQDAVNQLLKSNTEFKQLHDQHHELKYKVSEALSGPEVMDDLEVEQMKKEKLLLKDQMAEILRGHDSL